VTAAIGPPSAPERMAVRRARERLEEPDASHLSLRELAAVAGMSPFHFHRLFRAQIGLPPHAYQLRRRLLRARALLCAGQPAAHVAAATGFSDQSHFTRHFKRLLGITPSAYARRSKNVQD
jgi:AraC-like DNA-binding protein